MNKILITVYILFTGEQYDIFVPIGMKVLNVIELIQKTVNELDNEIKMIEIDEPIGEVDLSLSITI